LILDSIAFKTTGCHRFSHPEMSIPLEPRGGFSADWLIEYFETEVSKGRVFKSGETVQIGWGLVLLRDTPAGELEIWEPDFVSMPIQWRRGANATMRQLILQKSVAEALHCEPVFPSLRQACAVVPDWKQLKEITMLRGEQWQNLSGWSVASSAQEAATEWCSLYELGCHIPAVIEFLALPAGSEVRVRAEKVEIEYAGRRASSDDSKLLRELLSRYRGSRGLL
jgi:hypothetical protein